MNIPRRLIGRRVTISWMDPRGLRVQSHFPDDHRDIPHGAAGLAQWTEEGIIEKVEDDVLYLRQSIGKDPPGEGHPTDELQYSVVPAAIIESIKVWAEEPVEEIKT